MELFDVGVLETNDHIDPMSRIIHQRTSTWLTHCILFKDDKGNAWDPRPGGILNGNIYDYAGRKISILRFEGLYDKREALRWAKETQAKCKGYDFKALLGFLTGDESWEDKDYFYCSEMPYKLFQYQHNLLTRVDMTFVYPSFFFFHRDFKLMDEFVIPGKPSDKPLEFEFPLVVGAP
jgi:hypothetical protein